MRFFKFSILSIMMLFSAQVFSASSPLPTLKTAANNMIASLEKNKSQLKSRKVISQIVAQNLMPVVDQTRMAQLVIGRTAWSKASVTERNAFIQSFRQMVISTYAAALASYDGDKIKFYPMRGQGGSTAVVRSVIVRRTGQTIAISYNCRLVGSRWKVYDFSIENVSMVNSYRSQFASIVSQKGLSGLVAQMRSRRR